MGERTRTDGISSGNGSGEDGGVPDGNAANGAGRSAGADSTANSQRPTACPQSGGTPAEPTTTALDAFQSCPSLYNNRDDERECVDEGIAEEWRKPAYRDYARVIHSPSWRRLQGKTQLFPGHESDFFRNRLTHSLEVAQVAEAIALRLNYEHPYFQRHPLNERICSTAGLMHDLGHPPFGHNGEHALDDKMREYGGFEGNAQTLRIVTRLEKKLASACAPSPDGTDIRVGLNLTARVAASALKYDTQIPHVRDGEQALVKGYYADDAGPIERIKERIAPDWRTLKKSFKTIECSIMDLADDIAYSAYDLEDSLKAGFVTPGSILSSDEDLLGRVAEKVRRVVGGTISGADILRVLLEIFAGVVPGKSAMASLPDDDEKRRIIEIVLAFQASKNLAESGQLRTALTAQLVGEMVRSVEVEIDEQHPMLSKAKLSDAALLKVETLKNYNFEATIFSTRLKVAEFRGYGIVSAIFDALSSPKGYLLMPDDVRQLYSRFEANATARMRVVCDFIAGMTDRYAIEFYGRLHSDGHTIFKPI